MEKILFFINTLEGGGAELVLTETANALSEEYDVTVMNISNGGVHEKKLSDKVHYKSIIKCKNLFLRKIFSYLVSFVLPPSVIHKLFIGNGYDCEVAFLEGVPTKLISVAKTKKYAWVHTDLMNNIDGLDKVYNSSSSHIACYKRYDKIICVSESVKEAFFARFGIDQNTEVKYNIIDDALIIEKANEKLVRSDKLRIVSVGRLVKQKGYDKLIDALAKLRKDGFDFELLLVGTGTEYESLKKLAEELGISDSVEFEGYSDNPYKYMQSADFLVFPSRAEGYSTVVTEAVILGKPIIVSDCSGMREILGDSEFGIVTNNDEELCEAIKTMICDRDIREDYAKKARIRGEAFSKSVRIEELKEIF